MATIAVQDLIPAVLGFIAVKGVAANNGELANACKNI
jgi:hypothetical protein